MSDPKHLGDITDEIIDLSVEEGNEFYVIYPKAKDFFKKGKIWIKRLRYYNAVTSFQKGIKSLKTCRVEDSEEERQKTDLLINLFQGLMICYNNMNRPKWACNAMKEVRLLTENKPPWRALYQEGRALTILGEYNRARLSYIRAKDKQPDNQDIKDEITKISKRISNLEMAKRELWERAMN
ncbi:inactive peptidyl-prolyl cis-trans isomerase shutdown [Drosophila takahashii]|uniref:inactive peptidyl-prolyl cis-trans isomerase shutdown n=1 Tax=Drosophila takahashii TaxID=29030 RepID=UPI001CF85CCA|nr:inactive peptidyl-prolyl cis-trans isomerase shutdown [Drosophila takahashii]